MSGEHYTGTMITAAQGGTANARRVALALGVSTDALCWAADVAWERGMVSEARALVYVAGVLAGRPR